VEELDPNKLLEAIITTTTESPDGSARTETTTTAYNYDADNQLIGASGHTEFSGQEADWWEFKDIEGHTLRRHEDEEGNITYSYVDPETKETIIVSEDQVIATLKDGNRYNGASDIQYEILYGKPMAKQIDTTTSYYHAENLSLISIQKSTVIHTNGLVNNLRRVLSTQTNNETTYVSTDYEGRPQKEIQDFVTTYVYADNGNLIDAFGEGTGSGYEFNEEKGWTNYTSTIEIDYQIILGEARQKEFIETKHY
jgi:hypothetical protein